VNKAGNLVRASGPPAEAGHSGTSGDAPGSCHDLLPAGTGPLTCLPLNQ
jgi:hypothetical protein